MKQYRIIYETQYTQDCGEGQDGCLCGNLILRRTDTPTRHEAVVSASNIEMARYRFAADFYMRESFMGYVGGIADYFEDAVSNIVSISEVA